MRPVDIPTVEDSSINALMAREVLTRANAMNRSPVVEDGAEALRFLRQGGRYATAPRPDLILLDLSLPRINGREFLAGVKSDASLKLIPVVVLTTSAAEEDVLKAYGLHANCYITKPGGFPNLSIAITSMPDFWLPVVSLPPRSAAHVRQDSMRIGPGGDESPPPGGASPRVPG